MLFKSMGVALAAHASTPSDELKTLTIRLPEKEVQLYDVVAKTMGLNRQDFLQHLIRSTFRDAFKDFLVGYSQSSPSVALIDLMYSHTEDGLVKGTIKNLLESISNEIQAEDEQAIQKHLDEDTGFYQFASPPQGVFGVSK